jgi:hypothetical protein
VTRDAPCYRRRAVPLLVSSSQPLTCHPLPSCPCLLCCPLPLSCCPLPCCPLPMRPPSLAQFAASRPPPTRSFVTADRLAHLPTTPSLPIDATTASPLAECRLSRSATASRFHGLNLPPPLAG